MYIDVPWGLRGLRRNAWLNSRASASEFGTRRNSYDWLGPSEIPTLSSRNLGALAKALHKLHDLFTTAVRRSPQGCVSNRPMCSLSTWKLLTRHTAFYIASCQLHSSEVPIVVSCNHRNKCVGLKLLQWSSATKDMACLEIRPLCQLHPRSTVQKPLQMKLGHLPESFHCHCLWWYFRTLAKSRSFIIRYISIDIHGPWFISTFMLYWHRPTHFMLFGWGIAPGSFGVGIKLPAQVRTICLAGASGS